VGPEVRYLRREPSPFSLISELPPQAGNTFFKFNAVEYYSPTRSLFSKLLFSIPFQSGRTSQGEVLVVGSFNTLPLMSMDRPDVGRVVGRLSQPNGHLHCRGAAPRHLTWFHDRLSGLIPVFVPVCTTRALLSSLWWARNLIAPTHFHFTLLARPTR